MRTRTTSTFGYLYWSLTGAVLGLSAPLIFSLGMPLLLLGVILLFYGARRRLAPESRWVSYVVLGAAPALLLAYSYLANPSCSAGSSPCLAFSPDYLAVVAFFGVVALGALALHLLQRVHGP